MTPLRQEFVDNCRVERGFRLRGMEITRLEVFVDAAFAFAATMLVISFDSMPRSYEEVMLAVKDIPAFIMAVAQLVWIWHTHNIWSRRFGLDTTYTVYISTALLIVMLVYVYPMRIMAASMFTWITGGFLPANFNDITLPELANMFIFLAIGFVALSLVFVEMYRYALRLRAPLLLNDFEVYESRTLVIMWTGAAAIGLLCLLAALTLPIRLIPYSGFVLFLLGIWFPAVRTWRRKVSI